MSSEDPLQQFKDQILSNNKNVAPKAVLLSVAINSALSVRFAVHHTTLQPLLFDIWLLLTRALAL
jgi:hypothetical protein